MFRNYLSAALRSFARNRLHTAINVIGLTVGFSSALLIVLYVRDEMTFDRFIPGAKDVYAIYCSFPLSGRAPAIYDSAPADLTEALRVDYRDRFEVTHFASRNETLRRGEFQAVEPVTWADEHFFSVLPLPVAAGNLGEALKSPDGLALTRTAARKYFGKELPLGEEINVLTPGGPPQTLVVRAVLQDLPSNTNLTAQLFASGRNAASRFERIDAPSPYVFGNAQILLRSREADAADELRRELPAFLAKHKSEAKRQHASLELHALTDVHLLPTEGSQFRAKNERSAVLALLPVAVLILLASGINFVNLMTARATRRAVEIGVRKACGARRRDLFVQFVGECVLLAALGALGAAMTTELAMPFFNAVLDRQIEFAPWRDPQLIGALIGFVVVVGTLAGIYPALMLSAFRPVAALKRRMAGGDSALVRQTLAVVQFAAFIGLIIVTLVIYRQTHYATEEVAGLSKKNVVLVSIRQVVPPSRIEAYVEALRHLQGVANVTTSDPLALNTGQVEHAVALPGGEQVPMYNSSVDFGFFEFYGLAPLAGRLFERDRGSDVGSEDPKLLWTAPLVINESAARRMGFATPAAAIGQRVTPIDAREGISGPSQIIGVVPDFTFKSIRQRIEPSVYFVAPSQNRLVSVRIAAANPAPVLAAMDALDKQFFPAGSANERVFLQTYLENLYLDLRQQGSLFATFAGVAVFIACLGLLGLCASAAERRTREIGIRKSMGATRGALMRLLVWQFAKPVLWANLLAWPVAGYFMARWLQRFAYHIDLAPWLFLLPGVLALAITLATVSGHAIVASRGKPAAALRYE